MDPKDYYRILGVSPEAGAPEIKAAYRKLAFQYHPDRNEKNPSAAEQMKLVNEAYAVLSNPAKRREYDRLRRQFGSAAYNRFREGYTQQDIFNGSDIHQVFEEMARGFGLRGYEDVFKDFYGDGFRTFEFKRPGFFMRGFVFSGMPGGGKKGPVRLAAGGSAAARLAQTLFQKALGLKPARKGKDIQDTVSLDEVSAREGGPYAYYHRKLSKKLVVKVPPGVREGQKIRLAGMGEPGKGGGSAGDLYLRVHVKRPLLDRVRRLLSRKGG